MAAEARSRTDRDPAQLAREAKVPITAAAGPYGHPFHPILVTVPIGAWVGSLVFDIASRLDGDGSPGLVEASYWLIGLGVVGALLAAVFGLMDLLTIPRRTRALKVALTHMSLNLAVVGLYTVNFFWRRSDYLESAEVATGPLVLSVVAIVLLAVSGFLGGMLAYRYGVRVADETTQAEGYR